MNLHRRMRMLRNQFVMQKYNYINMNGHTFCNNRSVEVQIFKDIKIWHPLSKIANVMYSALT